MFLQINRLTELHHLSRTNQGFLISGEHRMLVIMSMSLMKMNEVGHFIKPKSANYGVVIILNVMVSMEVTNYICDVCFLFKVI